MRFTEIQNARGRNRSAGHRGVPARARPISCHGFTLIELLVVIAILVLLMAVLLPTLQRARNQARTVVCQGKLRQFSIFFSARVSDGEALSAVVRGNQFSLVAKLEPCYGPAIRDLLLCPVASRPDQRVYGPDNTSHGQPYAWASRRTAWWGSPDGVHLVTGSYGVNCLVGGMGGDNDDGRKPGDHSWTYSPAAAKGSWLPAIPVVVDGAIPLSSLSDRASPPPCEDPAPYSPYDWQFCLNRHGGSVNHLFLDWSVRKVGLKELWTLRWSRWFNSAGPWTKAGGVQPEDWPQWMSRFKDY